MLKPEIRKSYLLNKYVIITPGRAKRPRDIKEQTIVTRNDSCPFCPENINKKNIVDQINNNPWQVLSIHNIFPAVSLDNKKAPGKQEVIIDTPKHNKDLGGLSVAKIKLVLEMYVKRTSKIAKIKDKNGKSLDYILCFKNQGSKSGASIAHAHSQIFASSLIPPDLLEEQAAVKEYQKKHNSCPYCDIIKKEMKSSRKIFEDKHTAVFSPFASEFHYEAWIFPKRHTDNISLLNKNELNSLANSLKIVLKKLDSAKISFNYFLHNVVSDAKQHFYIKVQPRDSVWAGIELGSGLIINSVSPEESAKFYRT